MDALMEWLGAGTAGLIVLAVVGWALSRRKTKAEIADLGADTASKILKMSSSLREEMAKDLADVKGQLAEHIEGDLEGKRRRAKAYLEHQEWDEELATLARQAGIPISDPPPLHEEG